MAKVVRLGATRAQLGFDIYNLTNTEAPTTCNNGYVPNGAWLIPTAIQPARYLRLNATVDF